MEETTQQPTAEAAKRPTFLTVLCILSFIAAGLGIIGYISAIALAGMASAALSNVDASQVSYTGPSAGVIWAYIVVGFVTTLVGLFGVIQMWKLKKVGFFLYVGAQVVSIIMSCIYPGIGSAIVGLIFSILFIVLYGLNLKHLK